MIVLIDNYDSFTYNLVQRLGELDASLAMRVFRNDQTSLEAIEALQPTHIIISPGPCTPAEAGISGKVIEHFYQRIPILGVCLGHQCIGEVFGGRVIRADRIMHGKTSLVHHDGRGVYRDVANPFVATRYHSLIIQRDLLPADFIISAWTDEGEIMGVRHKHYLLEGVQYHPESFLTLEGPKLLRNFVSQTCSP